MKNQLLITFLFAIGFILLIIFNEYIFKKYKIEPEYSRKLTHILACLSSLLFLYTFDSHWNVLFLGFIFSIILFLGKKYNKTKSIDGVKRKTIGSYLLPISIYLLFVISEKLGNSLYFVLPLLVLGISDPLAGIFGTFYKHRARKIRFSNVIFDKTILGSTVFLIVSFLISFITLYFYDFEIFGVLIVSLIVSIIATFVEIISSRGTDNITVPLTVLLILYITDVLIY